MPIILKMPSGPIRPVIEALWDNEILHGYVTSMEDSAAYQLRRLKESGWQLIEAEGRFYHTIHGLDGESWHLETLFSTDFPALQRAAAFLVVWATFEHCLYELCREVATAADLKVKVSDLHGSGVRRARIYLAKVAELCGETIDSPWQEVLRLQPLRNLFAHGDGTIPERRKDELAWVADFPHITLRDKSILLEAGFMPHVLEVRQTILLALKESVETRFGRFEPVVFE